MVAPVECSQCGARNPAEAEWCGQCFASLVEQTVVGDQLPFNDEPAEDAISAPEGVPAPASAEVSTGRPEAASEPKTSTWVCSVCETSNALEVENCSACGTSIFRAFGAEVEEDINVDPQQALLRSVAFPGLGHAYAKQGLLGSAIGGLTLMSLGFGIGLAATGLGSFGWPLLLGALGVWVAAAFDAYRIAGGQETGTLLLKPRVITALVGSVVVTVILAATLRGNV
jgi:ribosomal protein L40E